jgi:dephospho-CoA kinase
MIVLGLTGSIGMGKSATAGLFAEAGVPVYDADAAVHSLYAAGGPAVAPLEAAFPGVSVGGAIDRSLLRARVIGDGEAMRTLESIVHPLTAGLQQAFRNKAMADGAPLIVLDIPLLFETGGWKLCDHTLVVTAPAEVQSARVLSRPGMTPEALEAILGRQMPDSEKRARADLILSTAYGLDYAREHVRAIIALMIRLDKEKQA